MKLRQFQVIPVLVSAALVVACSGETDELQAWIEQQGREVRPGVQALTPPKKFDPAPYLSNQGVDPFSPQKLAVALKQESKQPNSLLAEESNRRKEPLEAIPLDGMTMVGSVVKVGKTFALLRVDGLLYQVRPGDHLGQNYGKITKISETEVALRELVQDPGGEWVERMSALQLQEKTR